MNAIDTLYNFLDNLFDYEDVKTDINLEETTDAVAQTLARMILNDVGF